MVFNNFAGPQQAFWEEDLAESPLHQANNTTSTFGQSIMKINSGFFCFTFYVNRDWGNLLTGISVTCLSSVVIVPKVSRRLRHQGHLVPHSWQPEDLQSNTILKCKVQEHFVLQIRLPDLYSKWFYSATSIKPSKYEPIVLTFPRWNLILHYPPHPLCFIDLDWGTGWQSHH